MRARNKKTGEVIEDAEIWIATTKDGLRKLVDKVDMTKDEFDWEVLEDEEPKSYWYITEDGGVREAQEYKPELYKEISNYFETKEEAKKAVEKLKAYKRLKDNGFKFDGWGGLDINVFTRGLGKHAVDGNLPQDILEDLELLFGEEND